MAARRRALTCAIGCCAIVAAGRAAEPTGQPRPDHHLLVLVWRPAFEARHPDGERAPGRATPFVAGGLVPRSAAARREQDQPRHCVPSWPLTETLIRRAIHMMPDRESIRRSWAEYGGCGFASAREYFDRMAQLFDAVRQPDLQGVVRDDAVRAATVRAAFVSSNRPMGLRLEHLAVIDDPPGWFYGISICYGPQFDLTPCTGNRVPDAASLRVSRRGAAGRGAPNRETERERP